MFSGKAFCIPWPQFIILKKIKNGCNTTHLKLFSLKINTQIILKNQRQGAGDSAATWEEETGYGRPKADNFLVLLLICEHSLNAELQVVYLLLRASESYRYMVITGVSFSIFCSFILGYNSSRTNAFCHMCTAYCNGSHSQPKPACIKDVLGM